MFLARLTAGEKLREFYCGVEPLTDADQVAGPTPPGTAFS
nr:Spermidine synthase [Kibdelosporangium sp. MJ126-NF4]CTQ90735.1 Spermidine synthase (EC 2.5.1.16) [Kibdelosporangium sp. MJ126-NF4]